MRYLSFLNPLWLAESLILWCEPTTLMGAALTLSAAGTGISLVGQKQQADAQEEYQKQLAASNVESAQIESENVRSQQAQANEQNSREAFNAALANRKARATAKVAAGEAGVTGNSVDALMQEFQMEEGRYKEALFRQKALTDVSANQNIEAIRRGADANNLSMNTPISQPNYLAAALNFGANAAATGLAYRGTQTKTNAGGKNGP